MNSRNLIFAYAVGSLLLIAACGGGGDDENCSNMFGGPYPEDGEFSKQ